MGASIGQQTPNGVGNFPTPGNAVPYISTQNGAWSTRAGYDAPANQEKFAPCQQFPQPPTIPCNEKPSSGQSPQQCSGGTGGQFSWAWANDLTKMLPEAVQTLYAEGYAGLEARLRRAFQGLSPEQEVNIEAKLLDALERQKQAAVDREDYEAASHYKMEIHALMAKPPKGSSKGSCRAAGFARAASFLTTSAADKGKGKGKCDDRFAASKGKGKGKLDDGFDAGFDFHKGRGKGKFDDGCEFPKGMGKGTVCDLDEGGASGQGKGKGHFDDGFEFCKGKGKGKCDDSFDLSPDQGNVNQSFARRERAMVRAVDPCYSSFGTDGAFAGSFSSRMGPPSLSFHTDVLGNRSSFASPRTDASFAAGLPCSAARTGQPQLPVGVSFGATTRHPSDLHTTRLPTTTSFGSVGGYTTQRPSDTTSSFWPSMKPQPGLEMIQEEFFAKS